MIYPFSELLYQILELCASERRLNNTRRHLHVSRVYNFILIRYVPYILALRVRYTPPSWAPEPVPQVPQPRDQCCEGLMNFIISERGSADSAIIQSVNLNMLRVREQDAARGWVLMEMYTKQFSAAQLHNYLVSKNGCE